MAIYYRAKQYNHKVLATLVPKRTYTGEKVPLWLPQYKRGDGGEWVTFGDLKYPNYYGYKTAEEAESHIARHNQKWQTLYEGRYPLKEV